MEKLFIKIVISTYLHNCLLSIFYLNISIISKHFSHLKFTFSGILWKQKLFLSYERLQVCFFMLLIADIFLNYHFIS
jgi:hypothetical protein